MGKKRLRVARMVGLPVDVGHIPQPDTGQKRTGTRIARYVAPPALPVSHTVTPVGRDVPTINDQPELGSFWGACSDHKVLDAGEGVSLLLPWAPSDDSGQ